MGFIEWPFIHLSCIYWSLSRPWKDPWGQSWAVASARPGYKPLLSTNLCALGQIHFGLFYQKKGDGNPTSITGCWWGWNERMTMALWHGWAQCLAPSKCATDVNYHYSRSLPHSTAVWPQDVMCGGSPGSMQSHTWPLPNWPAILEHRWQKLERKGCSKPNPKDLPAALGRKR